MLLPDVKTWLTDGVRIFLDPNHNQSEFFQKDDRRYRVIGSENIIRESISRDAYVEGVQIAIGNQPPPKRSWHPQPVGYLVEMAFPWTTLGVKPEIDKLIGMELTIQDNDDGAELDSRLSWGGTDGSSPNTFKTIKLVRSMPSGSIDEYLPRQVWKEEDGYVVVEAETIDHHFHWEHKTEPEGFSGTGYLNWVGPNNSVTPDGRGGNDDYTNERQGPQREWLIIRVLVEHPGIYRMNARNHHIKEDGDNDSWSWKVGQEITDWNPVRRMGDSLKDGEGFTWLDWGVRSFWLKKGVNNLYIGGRSPGFGIDRVAIYMDGNEEAESKALDLSTPTSKRAK
jgi:hypothetical protein